MGNGIRKVEIVLAEGRISELFTNLGNVIIGAPREEDSFQVHQFLFRDVVYHIDEKDFFL